MLGEIVGLIPDTDFLQNLIASCWTFSPIEMAELVNSFVSSNILLSWKDAKQKIDSMGDIVGKEPLCRSLLDKIYGEELLNDLVLIWQFHHSTDQVPSSVAIFSEIPQLLRTLFIAIYRPDGFVIGVMDRNSSITEDQCNKFKDEKIKLLQQNKDRSFCWADLGDLFFGGLNLSGINFNYSNLKGLWLGKVTPAKLKLERANLKGVNLGEANLIGANLREANLEKVDLSKTDLRNANLIEVKNINLKGTIFEECRHWNLYTGNDFDTFLRAIKDYIKPSPSSRGLDYVKELKKFIPTINCKRSELEGKNMRELIQKLLKGIKSQISTKGTLHELLTFLIQYSSESLSKLHGDAKYGENYGYEKQKDLASQELERLIYPQKGSDSTFFSNHSAKNANSTLRTGTNVSSKRQPQ